MPPDPQPPDLTPRSLALVRRRLLAWYALERRDFPWRRTRDPWAVLVSEVMLQQTQAARVAQRFDAFLGRFPTPAAMAAASDAQVLAAWSGLGYNRRALALRRVAVAVSREGWPTDADGLARLPGIGAYTSRAVAALAFGQPVGAVDTNVRRWLVRRFGLSADGSPRALQEFADRLAAPAGNDGAQAAAWMHASMEFGARVCASRAARCGACPIARGCPSRLAPPAVGTRPQRAFATSRRATRGAVLRVLAAAPGHRLGLGHVSRLVGAELDESLLRSLERDGLLHRTRRSLRLGPAEVAPAEATIGA